MDDVVEGKVLKLRGEVIGQILQCGGVGTLKQEAPVQLSHPSMFGLKHKLPTTASTDTLTPTDLKCSQLSGLDNLHHHSLSLCPRSPPLFFEIISGKVFL